MRPSGDIIVWVPPRACLPGHHPRPPKPKTVLDWIRHHGTFSTRTAAVALHTLAFGITFSGLYHLATVPAVRRTRTPSVISDL